MEKSLLENGNDTIPTQQQIENRWKSMTHQFKKTAEHNNISGNNRKYCRYYEELNDIMGFRPNVEPVSTVGTIKRRNEENEENFEHGDRSDERWEKKKRKYTSTSSVIGDKILEKIEELRSKFNRFEGNIATFLPIFFYVKNYERIKTFMKF